MKHLPLLDKYGLYPLPQRLYGLLLLLLRPYLCWVLALTMRGKEQDMLRLFYPQQDDFILACVLAAPLLLLLAAISQRTDKGFAPWRYIWQQGRWLLLAVTSLDLLLTIAALPDDVMLDAPWRMLSVVALIAGLIWLLCSKHLSLIFAEWPEPQKADKGKESRGKGSDKNSQT
ncbi:DUF2919 family protein [Arsukibacterium sp.]|uniref:DUF2919 family protein n=1 Tax=Arsukibacterium sp. TaxID=1977258 RepID=UPI002FDA96D1